MDQRRGLEDVVPRFVAQIPSGQNAQLVVDLTE
jgi:hypothetical protein